jgi:uncharacterized protein (TIGR02246 family)
MSRHHAAAILISVSILIAQPSAQGLADEKAIRGLAAEFERAWNTHDMNILGSITTEDVDFVNVAGLHWKGKTQVVKEHADRHKVRFKNSVWKTEVQFVTPDVALVHLDWTTSGDLDFDLKPWPPRTGLFSWVVVRQNAAWKIRSVQDSDKS